MGQKTDKNISKGILAEEVLRDYFLSLGYFVVRGVTLSYQGNDVTDVDLWLYHRHSPLSRERINVDIKNKRTPQAIERILWARGLQATLNLDRCIVATTDNRAAVVDFGRDHGVVVLEGRFITGLRNRDRPTVRMTEEDFIGRIDADGIGKLGGDWNQRFRLAKSTLLTHLGYDACNGWLEDISYFVEQAQVHTQRSEAAVRLVYLLLSYFLIGLDFAVAELAFDSAEVKEAAIVEGLLHGSRGRKRTELLLGFAAKIASHYLADRGPAADKIELEFRNLTGTVPADILGQHFSKSSNLNQAFVLAKRLEIAAFRSEMIPPSDLGSEEKGVVAVVLDFLGVPRAKFFDLKMQRKLFNEA